MVEIIRRIMRISSTIVRWMLLWAFILVFVQYSTYPLGLRWFAISSLLKDHHFDYLGWEVNALAAKTAETLWGVHPYLDDSERAAWVRAYFADVAAVQALDAQIDAIYIDPAVTDPAEATAELRGQRDALRADLAARQGTAEASMEGQIAAVLVEEGFGVLGQLVPPISMRFTRAPNVLIVSPRDAIKPELTMSVVPLSTDQRAAFETAIDTREDVSSLIIRIGGMALFPAMIEETGNLTWAVQTFSHEWFHHYMFLYPLGLSYDSGEATRINETAADIFGREIGAKVLARYYPETVRATQETVISRDTSASTLDDLTSWLLGANIWREGLMYQAPTEYRGLSTALQFDYNTEMHETRVTVDALLAEGNVEEAEAYMEQRRVFFVENGYALRKLNQAYFAFYGGYQGGDFAGAGGTDPIGPAVREIRALSPSLLDFALNLRGVTDQSGLIETLERLRLDSAPDA